jgi:hypothetical protein
MKYLLLIYQDEKLRESAPAEAKAAFMAAYDEFNATYGSRGMLAAGAELHPVDASTTVRVRDGKPLVTDGPFMETKEQLAGYYVVDCDTLDEALAVTAAIPSARIGTIEVRPQVEGIGPST